MKDEPVFEYHADEVEIDIKLADSSVRSIRINPGWSFGTGGHETTRLCIHALQELFKTENIKSVLDIGCGSGILSIASSVLGAEEVLGIDIDSSIIDEARINADKNDLHNSIRFSTAPLSDIKGSFGLITANILLKTIESLLADISEGVAKNGLFLASGIKTEETPAAVNLIENHGFKQINEFNEGDWSALIFLKP